MKTHFEIIDSTTFIDVDLIKTTTGKLTFIIFGNEYKDIGKTHKFKITNKSDGSTTEIFIFENSNGEFMGNWMGHNYRIEKKIIANLKMHQPNAPQAE